MAWLVRTGDSGSTLPVCVVNAVVALRYTDVGDVRATPHATMVAQLAAMGTRVKNEELIRLLEQFADEVAIGDLIVTPHLASRSVYIGEIVGPYKCRDPSPVAGYPHLRPVRWITSLDRDTAIPADRLPQIDRRPTFYTLPDAGWWAAQAASGDTGAAPAAPTTAAKRASTRGASAPQQAWTTCPGCDTPQPARLVINGHCPVCE